MQLRTRILVLPLVAVAPAIALLWWNHLDLDRSRYQQVEQHAIAQARQVSAEVDRIAEGALQFLVALAQIPEIKHGHAACNDLLSRIRTYYRAYLALIRADISGNVTCSSIGPGPSIQDRKYFRKAVESNGFSVGEFVHGRGTRADTIHFSYPLRSEDGNVIGVIAAALDLQWFAERIAEKQPPDGAINIADANGTILVRLPHNERYRGQTIPEEFRWIIDSPAPSATRVVGLDKIEQLLGFVPIRASSTGFHVGVARDIGPAFDDIRRAQVRGYLITGSGLVCALLLASLWAEFGIRKPVTELLQAVHRWREGNYEPTGRVWGSSEFSRIGHAFDQLISVVADREKRLRESEQRLAANQQYLSRVLDEVPVGIMQTLPDKTYGFVNKGFCQLLGRTPEQLLGHSFLEFTHPDDAEQDALRFETALIERRPYSHRKRYLRPDGSTVWAANTVTHLEMGQGILAVSEDLTERIDAERMQKRLTDELDHRVKNTLATVQALIITAGRYSRNSEQLVEDLLGRIRALSATHNLLTSHTWERADLAELIRTELEPYSRGRNARFAGPDVSLSPREAISVGLLIHELTTNAAKHGALKTEVGRLQVLWKTADTGSGRKLTITWEETGLDKVAEPATGGFGSRLIQQCVRDLAGSISKEFRSSGLFCTINVQIESMLA